MSNKNKKRFGVWMDSHHATIVGMENPTDETFAILGLVSNEGPDNNSSENAANNQEIALTHKYFKEIAGKMVNIDEIHITGTGQIQEQFVRFLSDTPQYKNTQSTVSTSIKMNDEQLVSFIAAQYN